MKTRDGAGRVSEVTNEHILQRLLDLLQLSRTKSEPTDEQLQDRWTAFLC